MRVLQLVTYPTKRPMHGGQIRVSQIRKWLTERGAVVKTVSVSEPTHDEYGEDDLVVDLSAEPQPYELPFCTDFLTSQLSESVGYIFDYIETAINTFNPDYIFLEHPWLWPAVRKLIALGLIERNDFKIIYSSHNLEFSTKESILNELGLNSACVAAVVKEIKDLECSLAQSSDWVVAVTYEDAENLRHLGAKNVTVCPNGVAPRSAKPEIISQVNRTLYGRKYLIYVGSAYPPNAAGFWDFFGPSLATFNPDETIVLVGGVSEILSQYAPLDEKMFSYVNGQVITRIGKVSEDVLQALIYGASGFILPIMSGGGSNLKTAEAIASGLPIVASPVAMRGYEEFMALSNLYVESSRESFIKAAVNILRNPVGEARSELGSEEKLRQSVYWAHTLKNLDLIVT